jgi:Arc/MetJ-type ribon-helix-helix transcriptional regulator
MSTFTIRLPESAVQFVRQQAFVRGFKTPEEFLATLVTDSQERLEAALVQGLDSGPSRKLTADDWNKLRQNVHDREARKAPHAKS